MTHKEKFIKALKRESIVGHVPHFELVFYLTAESLGRVHPQQRSFGQWGQMSLSEKKWHIDDIADLHIKVAEKYDHSAIFIHHPFNDMETIGELLRTIKEKSNDEYFLMMHADPTFSMPDGYNMIDFTAQMYEEPERLKEIAKNNMEGSSEHIRYFADKKLLDGATLCSDYCFNVNPFFTPELFDAFIHPYLKEIIKRYREMGLYTIKHTDGNIMPILDQLADCEPDALHSLDPQGGVSLKEVKKLYGDKLCLIGNVNCGLLQTGTEEECTKDIRRSLTDGMEGNSGGYIFSTSNCVYTGLQLERYELMHRIWKAEGIYK